MTRRRIPMTGRRTPMTGRRIAITGRRIAITRRRIATPAAILLAPVLAAAAPAAPAAAAGASASARQTVFLTAIGQPVPSTMRSIPVRATGALVVDFHGDAAAGCAARGVCGDSGTITWVPDPNDGLQVLRTGRHLSYQLVLFPQTGGAVPSGTTTAEVTQPGTPTAGACVDAVPTGTSTQLPVSRGRIGFTLRGTFQSLLSTRCAGPRDATVLPVLPVPRIPVRAVTRGRLTVSLAAARPFSGDGFAGTVSSTLSLHLGRPGRATPAGGQTPPGPRRRALVAVYRVAVAGSVVEHVQGDPTPGACAPLGACGASGTVTLTPRVMRGTARITATEPIGRRASELRAVFGLGTRRPGAGRGVSIGGGADWRAGGTIATQISQGASTCRDSGPLGPGSVVIFGSGQRLAVAYLAPFALSSTTAAIACPGPLGASGDGLGPSERVPLGRLRSRRIVLPIHGSTSWTDDGYRIHTTSDLTLTLTRMRTRLTTVAAGTF